MPKEEKPKVIIIKCSECKAETEKAGSPGVDYGYILCPACAEKATRKADQEIMYTPRLILKNIIVKNITVKTTGIYPIKDIVEEAFNLAKNLETTVILEINSIIITIYSSSPQNIDHYVSLYNKLKKEE